MPLPRWLARANRVATNPVALTFSGRLTHFAIVVHRGRRTGTIRRTPVNAFPDGMAFVIPLTYGTGADWVGNVFAAGGCVLVYRGEAVPLFEPSFLAEAEARAVLPTIVRSLLTLFDVHDFVRLTRLPS
jgi:deazaflavin-dependent oxidoreductase (nitroreductase family)